MRVDYLELENKIIKWFQRIIIKLETYIKNIIKLKQKHKTLKKYYNIFKNIYNILMFYGNIKTCTFYKNNLLKNIKRSSKYFLTFVIR